MTCGNWLTLSVLAVLAIAANEPRRAAAQQPSVQPSRTIEVPQDGRRGRSVVSAVAINSQNAEVAAAGDDHMVRVFRADQGGILRTLRGHTDWVRCLAYGPDGKLLASGGDDRNVIIWDAETGQSVRTIPLAARAIYSLAFSPDGEQLAIGGFDARVHIRSVATGEELRSLECTCRDIRTVAWSPDGATIAAAGQDGNLLIWSAGDGQLLHTLRADRRRVRGISFSPDAAQIAAAGEGRNIRVFDVATGAEATNFELPPGRINALVHCGQDTLATGGSDNIIRLWSLKENKETHQLVGHKGSVNALNYDQSSQTLVSGSFDTTIMFWRMGDVTRTTLQSVPPIR